MLREESAAAERADLVLMRSGEGEEERTSSLGSDFRLVTEGIFTLAELLSPWVDSTGLENAAGKNRPLGRGVAFAGIGLPQSFEDSLATLGVTLAAMVRFPDHRAFTTSDLRLLAQLRERTDAGYFITTEKDGCRLLPLMLRARYAEGREVHWPESLLPPPATSLPNLIVAAEQVWEHAFFARVAAVLPAAAVTRFLEVVGASSARA